MICSGLFLVTVCLIVLKWGKKSHSVSPLMNQMNKINKNYLILLILSFAILMVSGQSKGGPSKDSKGGPLSFFQNLLGGFGGGKKKWDLWNEIK